MQYDTVIHVGEREISLAAPTYFVADIASNHDGDLEKAKHLIYLAKEAGADAVKFQHFLADKIVSDYGFRELGGQVGHQASWKQSVYDVFRACECKRSWSEELARTAADAGIDFLTTPYDAEAVEQLDRYIPAYKIGSGDITWTSFIRLIAGKGKPVFLATGASTMADVERAVAAVLAANRQLVLMQCNTNYTGSLENFHCINLNVLKTYAVRYPGMVLGLSDHTPGHATVLGAIALGARVIEKHFTSDNKLIGPDHPFSMNPKTWREMVDRSRELEQALGTGTKIVEANEQETVVVQRRALHAAHDIAAGTVLQAGDIEALRPAPVGAFLPYEEDLVVGRTAAHDMKRGAAIHPADLAPAERKEAPSC